MTKREKYLILSSQRSILSNYMNVNNTINVSYIRVLRQRNDFRYLKNPNIIITKMIMNKDKDAMYPTFKKDTRENKRVIITKKELNTTSVEKRKILDWSILNKKISSYYGIDEFKRFIRYLCKKRVEQEISDNPDYRVLKFFEDNTFIYMPDIKLFTHLTNVNASLPWLDERMIIFTGYFIDFIHKANKEDVNRDKYLYAIMERYENIRKKDDPSLNDAMQAAFFM